MKYKNIGIILIIFIAILVGGSIIYTKYQSKGKEIEGTAINQDDVVRKKAYDFTLKTIEGEEISLSDYQGKSSVVLNLWASWCPPCKEEMPYFEELEKEYEDKNVVFLMINLTSGRETRQSAVDYLASAGYNFKHVLLDEEGIVAVLYNARSIPKTFVINEKGEIVAEHLGKLKKEEIRKLIDEGLNI